MTVTIEIDATDSWSDIKAKGRLAAARLHEGKTTIAVSRILGVSTPTVKRWMLDAGIGVRGRAPRPISTAFAERSDPGGRMAAARVARGMRQRDLAEAVGLSVSYLAGLERGIRPVPKAKRQQIADALGTTVAHLEGKP